MVASPLVKQSGERMGTFEVWHRSSRDGPFVAHGSFHLSDSDSYDIAVIAEPRDVDLEPVPPKGLSLLEVLTNLPCMSRYLEARGIVPQTVRANVSANIDRGGNNVRARIDFDRIDAQVFDTWKAHWRFGGRPYELRIP